MASQRWQTEILNIDIEHNCNRTWFDIDLRFRIDPENDYYPCFVNLSQEFVKVSYFLFEKEDYLTYLKEEEAEDIDIFAEECFEPTGEKMLNPVTQKWGSTYLWNPPENAYDRLLDKRLNKNKDIFTSQQALLDYDEETGVFVYREAIVSSPATLGMVQELRELQQEIHYDLRHYLERTLLNIVESLDKFWD